MVYPEEGVPLDLDTGLRRAKNGLVIPVKFFSGNPQMESTNQLWVFQPNNTNITTADSFKHSHFKGMHR